MNQCIKRKFEKLVQLYFENCIVEKTSKVKKHKFILCSMFNLLLDWMKTKLFNSDIEGKLRFNAEHWIPNLLDYGNS